MRPIIAALALALITTPAWAQTPQPQQGAPVTLYDGAGVERGSAQNPMVTTAGGASSITPLGVTGTPAALTTSGTPGTFTTALAASSSRKGCTIQYAGTHLLYVYIGGGTASTAASEQLQPGQTFSCSPLGATIVEQGLLSIASTAATDSAVVVSQ